MARPMPSKGRTAITFAIDSDLDARLRKAVAARLGAGKGTLGVALAEAIELWLKQPRKE